MKRRNFLTAMSIAGLTGIIKPETVLAEEKKTRKQ